MELISLSSSLFHPLSKNFILSTQAFKIGGQRGHAGKDYKMSIPPLYFLLLLLKEPNADATALHRTSHVQECIYKCPLKVRGTEMGVRTCPHPEQNLCSPSPLLLTPPPQLCPQAWPLTRGTWEELDPCLKTDLAQGPSAESSNGLGICQRRRGIIYD